MIKQAQSRWQTFQSLLTPASVPARMSIWIYALYSIGQGIGICAGGIERWAGPGYTVIRQVPGSPYSWGAALAILGVLLCVASLRKSWGFKAVVLLGFVGWSMAFAYGAFKATATVPIAGTTGGPAYLLHAAAAAVLIMIDERRRPNEEPPA